MSGKSKGKMGKRRVPMSEAYEVMHMTRNYPVSMTKDDWKQIERKFNHANWRPVRRVATLVLTFTGEELIQKITSKRFTTRAFMRLNQRVEDYLKFLDDYRKLVYAGHLRMATAACFSPHYQEIEEDLRAERQAELAVERNPEAK